MYTVSASFVHVALRQQDVSLINSVLLYINPSNHPTHMHSHTLYTRSASPTCMWCGAPHPSEMPSVSACARTLPSSTAAPSTGECNECENL